MQEVLRSFDADSLRLYPDPAAGELLDALAERYHVKPSQVFVGVGSDDVLAMAFLTFFNSEKPVLFPDITYSFYDVWAELFRIPTIRFLWTNSSGLCRRIISRTTEESYFRIPTRPRASTCL